MPDFRLLVIADTHYGPGTSPEGTRCYELGCELLRRAIEDAKRRGGEKPFDAIALMGDLVNNGRDADSDARLAELWATIDEAAPDAPLLVVPGNHDKAGGPLPPAFRATPGLRELGGYRFLVFDDPYAEGDFCTRREADRRLLSDLAAAEGGPVVVLQHNPMNPPVDYDEYPFMLTNREQVMRDYASASVLLSLSGHYHDGQPLNFADGVAYFTAPALCQPPFEYAVVTLKGREVSVEQRRLAAEKQMGLIDCHTHTELAYCRLDVTARGVVDRAHTFGLAGVCLLEHAPQLYCAAEDYWAARHIHQPQVWRNCDRSRMDRFRKLTGQIREIEGDFVRIALEVEVDKDGQLTVQEQDREFLDLLVGAVHWLPIDADDSADEDEIIRQFQWACRGLLSGDVDILAHPWRYFLRSGLTLPEHLFGWLADELAASGAAAELSLHHNPVEEPFFAECIRRGVKIALASDAHALYEAGALSAHMDILHRLAGAGDIAPLLWPG